MTKVPRRHYLHVLQIKGHVIDTVQFNKGMTYEKVLPTIHLEFSTKLSDILSILMPQGKSLCHPVLGSGQTLSGPILARVFSRKTIYIKPATIIFHSPQELIAIPSFYDHNYSSSIERRSTSCSTYGEYLNIISRENITDGSETDSSEPETVLKDLTTKACHDSQVSSKSLLEELSGQIDPDHSMANTLANVCRSDVWNRMVHAISPSYNPQSNISVMFMDDVGNSEGAVDLGGPKRELFRLLLQYIETSEMFCGRNAKFVNRHCESYQKGRYRLAGHIMALSLVHGSPAPRFFSNVMYQHIVGRKVDVRRHELVGIDICDRILSLWTATNLEMLHQVVDENITIIDMVGCWKPITKLEDGWVMYERVIEWFFFKRCKEEIESLKEGLNILGVLDTMIQHPEEMAECFVYKAMDLTATMLMNWFTISNSPTHSCRWASERVIVAFWRDLLMDCEEHFSTVTLEDILIFMMGLTSEPPLGFKPPLTLEFLDPTERYPVANTCANTLRLPMCKSYEDFKNAMEFGILNCQGFGMA